MGRSPSCSKESMNRGAWTALEDKILNDYVKLHGEGRWRDLPQKAGLRRSGKSCRLRWLNYLRPGIKRGNISQDEEDLIIRLHKLLGNRWSLIAGRLPGRTDNEIKNYWKTNLGKKVQKFNHKKPARSTITKIPIDPIPVASTVVRAKAVKCTKVILNHAVATNIVVDKVSMTRRSLDTVAASSSQINQFETGETLLEDLDLDDLFLSNILMNEDCDHNAFYCDINDGINEIDVVKEQQNMGPEFNSFASLFLDGVSEGDWLVVD